MLNIYETFHSESAKNVNKFNKDEKSTDIVKGEYILDKNFKIEVPIKIEYFQKEPYYLTGNKRKKITNSEEIKNEWLIKGKKVFYIEGEYFEKIKWETVLDDENWGYFWSDNLQNIYISKNNKKRVRDKIENLNNENRKIERIYKN